MKMGIEGQPPSMFKVVLFLLHLLSLLRCNIAEERSVFLVLMEGDSVAFQQKNGRRTNITKSVLVESHDKLLGTSLDVGSYDKLYSFHHVINGFAIHTTPSQAKKLERAKGVVTVEKDRAVKLMTTYTPKFLGLQEGPWARVPGWPGNAGKGMVIGFVDTGIDPMHLSFAYGPDPIKDVTSSFSGGCDVGRMFPIGSCNGKIVAARHYWVGAARTLPIGEPKDLSPFDDVGHGTHVASIAAGNKGVPVVVNGFNYGYASGMAPLARIAVYKALYPQGGSLADVVSAIDQAIRDGVDVLTLSIGPDEPPSEKPIFMNIFDIMLLYARRLGVFVAQAAGNKGPAMSSVVSYSPWAMSVAACSTNRVYTTTLILGNSVGLTGVGISGPTPGNGDVQYRLVAAKDATLIPATKNDQQYYAEECQNPEALQPTLVRGSIVICNFSRGFATGESTITALLRTAMRLGFAGFVLVANPNIGDLVAQPLPLRVPGLVIPRIADVKILMDYYEEQTIRDEGGSVLRYNGRAEIKDGRFARFVEDINSVAVSRFSSRGPDVIDDVGNPADVLKPDVLAPGYQIWAAWSPTSAPNPILAGYSFALLSGTSMATPHVSGIAALIKQQRPAWNPSMIASALSTTASKFHGKATPIMSEGSRPNTFYPSTPFDYGSGLVNPTKALDPGLVFCSVFEDYVAFLCSLPNIDPWRVLRITGTSCNTTAVTMHSPTDLNLPSLTISSLKGSKLVRRQVTNVAGKAETYSISTLPPRGVNIQVNPSWFTVDPHGSQHLEIIVTSTGTAPKGVFLFGEVVLTGSLDHIVRFPVSVKPAP